jgi:hypothetical protein
MCTIRTIYTLFTICTIRSNPTQDFIQSQRAAAPFSLFSLRHVRHSVIVMRIGRKSRSLSCTPNHRTHEPRFGNGSDSDPQ